MKRKKWADILTVAVTAALLVLLVLLTVLVLHAYRRNSLTEVPFDLGAVTADRSPSREEVSSCLLPEFVGISTGGFRRGLIGSENVMRELTATLYPALSEILTEGEGREASAEEWLEAANTPESVYLRWHSELGDPVVRLAVGAPAGEGDPFYIEEIFLFPFDGESVRALFCDGEGSVRALEAGNPRAALDTADFGRILRTFRSSMTDFVFREGDERAQPVLSARVRARSVIMTQNTASLLTASVSEQEALLSVFGLNPDKLLTVRREEDGVMRFLDTHGEVNIRRTYVMYQATQDSGMPLSSFTSSGDAGELASYVRAALSIAEGVREVNRHLAGGDAGLLLTGVRTSGGEVRLIFDYMYDNIRITDVSHALTLTFEDGFLKEAVLYTLTLQGTGQWSFVDMVGTSFYRWIAGKREVPLKVSLGYRADFLSEAVLPCWRGTEREEP